MKPVKIALVVIWLAALLSGVFLVLSPLGRKDMTSEINALGRDLYSTAKDTSLDRDVRLAACDLYLKHCHNFAELNYMNEIKSIKSSLSSDRRSIADSSCETSSTAVEESDMNADLSYSERTLYEKCVGSDGTLEDCKTFIDKYKNDDSFKTDLENVKEKMNDLGQKLYEKAKDTRLTNTERLQACEEYIAYVHYFDRLKFLSEIREIKTSLTGETNVNTNNPAPTPATEAGSKPTEKKKIKTYEELFEALGDVDAVVNGTFNDKYVIGNVVRSRTNVVNNIIVKAKKLENNEYKEIYKTVKAMNKGSADKLTELGKRVKQKAKEK